MGGCSPEEKVMKKKIVLFFRTINSIDTKCDETMFKMKTNCEQNMTETIHIIRDYEEKSVNKILL